MKGKSKLIALALSAFVLSSNKVDAASNEVVDKEIVNYEDNISKSLYVKANEDIEIRQYANIDSNVIGTLSKGDTLLYNTLWDEGFYEVKYNDSIGFVECNKSDLIWKYNFNHMVTFTDDTTLYSDENEDIEIEKQSVGKLFANIGSWSLVEVDGNTGYVKSQYTDVLDDTFVVVDISDQTLQLYNNNEVILQCPIISGKSSTPSTLGDFTVYEKRYNTVLKDAKGTYASPVDVFMKYHNGEGLHDAYRWRNDSEYDILDYYLKRGSHGCINMKREDALFLSDYVDVGTRVLVKK